MNSAQTFNNVLGYKMLRLKYVIMLLKHIANHAVPPFFNKKNKSGII